MRGRLGNIVVALASLIATLLLAEGLVRLVVEPVDYLRPDLVRDTVLRWRVAPNSAGHDRWGYRNRRVPARADVVTLGDSQTYGHGAVASDSWPAWLARLTGWGVYNMGLGGFGPIDYRYLAATRLDSLRPDLVVVGLYLGNDFVDAYRSVYRRNRWQTLRDTTFQVRDGEATEDEPLPNADPEDESWLRTLKAWFGGHSVLYGMAAVAGRNVLRTRSRETVTEWDPGLAVVRDSAGGLITALDPVSRARRVDRSDPTVLEGFRLTREALAAIQKAACIHGASLRVLLIPTKVRVYAEARPNAMVSGRRDLIDRLVADEATLTHDLKQWLDDEGIRWTDALPALREAAESGRRIYPRTENGHPTGEGYRVIADALAADLEEPLK